MRLLRISAILAVCLAATGCQNYLGFGTGTIIGFDLSPKPDNSVNLTFGFQRYELAVIPVSDFTDADQVEDCYSVLATIKVNSPGLNSPPDNNFRVTQLFATGRAARGLSSRSGINAYFADFIAQTAEAQKKEGSQ